LLKSKSPPTLVGAALLVLAAGLATSASATIITTSAASSPAVPAPLIGHGLLVLLAVSGVLFGRRCLEKIKARNLRAA
jgi:hypothetical protein